MKGNKKIIDTLNVLLAEELTAISQYMVHSEMCDDWGYGKLHLAIEARAKEEMRHAERLIGRIIFLEGSPVVSKLNRMSLGPDVQTQHKNDLKSEVDAVKAYNDAVRLAAEVGDNGSREMLQSILQDEENHVDWLESQLELIAQVGIQNYLSQQV